MWGASLQIEEMHCANITSCLFRPPSPTAFVTAMAVAVPKQEMALTPMQSFSSQLWWGDVGDPVPTLKLQQEIRIVPLTLVFVIASQLQFSLGSNSGEGGREGGTVWTSCTPLVYGDGDRRQHGGRGCCGGGGRLLGRAGREEMGCVIKHRHHQLFWQPSFSGSIFAWTLKIDFINDK